MREMPSRLVEVPFPAAAITGRDAYEQACISKFAVLLILLAAVVAGAFLPPCSAQAPGKKVAVAKDYGKLPLSFEANLGQTDPQVRFLSRGNGYSLFLTDSAAVLSLRKTEASPTSGPASQTGENSLDSKTALWFHLFSQLDRESTRAWSVAPATAPEMRKAPIDRCKESPKGQGTCLRRRNLGKV